MAKRHRSSSSSTGTEEEVVAEVAMAAVANKAPRLSQSQRTASNSSNSSSSSSNSTSQTTGPVFIPATGPARQFILLRAARIIERIANMYLNNKNPPATALNTQIEAAINHSYNTLKDYPHGQYLFYHVLNCDYVDDAAIDTLIFLLANDMANRVHIDVAQREMERAKVMNHGKFFSDDQ